MARAGAAYPQVELSAAALASARVAPCAADASAADALRLCRRSGARAVTTGTGRLARAEDLARMVDWGLGALPAAALAWTGLPVVGAAASEIEVRRRFLAGAPSVLVKEGRRVVGVIDRERAAPGGFTMPAAARIDRPAAREGEARLWLLRVAGKAGEGMGAPAFAVGGFVRDLLLGRVGPDLDVMVEGDGIAFARRLVGEVGGKISIHPGFGTASIEGARAGGGTPLPRIDVSSARRERYEQPGALPRVAPARLAEDLERRDFAINAMAMALAPSEFGRVVDPRGGRRDLDRGLLRPLHPLSFVEDPTRIFRAARYGARLGFRLASEGRAALRLALRVGRYPALSGQRLRAELELMAAEPNAIAAFDRILRWGATNLWDIGHPRRREVIARLRALGRLRRRLPGAGLELGAGEAALIALLIGRRAGEVAAGLDRLAITGALRRDALAAVGARGLAARLDRAVRPSTVARLLDGRPPAVLAGAWIEGRPRARRRIEWYVREGRPARPALSGADLIALGVPRGPAVGLSLARLRRLRLDGRITSPSQERQHVKRWLDHPSMEPIAARKEA